MKKERVYEYTNIYALEEEIIHTGIYDRFAGYWDEKKADIQKAVENQDIGKLQEIYHDYTFITRCRTTSEFAEFVMAMEIYEEEQLYGEYKTIFSDARSLEKVIEKLTETKFALFRLEFFGDEEAYSHLLSVINDYGITATCLKMMLRYVNYNKVGVALKLSKYFVKVELLRYAQALLEEAKGNNG